MLYFPAGVYLFNSGILLNKNNVVIKGDGGNLNQTCITKFYFQFNSTFHGATINMTNNENCGIEDIYIYRNDGLYEDINSDVNSDNAANGIKLVKAKWCWVRGVYSENAYRNHILMIDCEKVTVSGCYFFDAQVRGDGGQGYGILMQGRAKGLDIQNQPYGSIYCLIENNIFRNLRHAIVLQERPQQNVIGYNFSIESFEYSTNMPDLSFHGRFNLLHGPSYNLIEGNVFREVKFDMTHNENGPSNTLFRSVAWNYHISSNFSGTDPSQFNQNVVDSHTTPLSDLGIGNLASMNIFTNSNIIGYKNCAGPSSNCWPSGQYSYYKSSQPDFLDSWPFMPDSDMNGAQKRFNLGTMVVNQGWNKYSFITTNINSNITWDSDKTFPENSFINIEPNATLNINNCTISMLKNSLIKVNPGAKLVINNSKITSTSCDLSSMWKGIFVLGTSNQPQENSFYSPFQGIVQIMNSTIEHANKAICLWNPAFPGNFNSTGGIIEAVNSDFFNNTIAVEFMPFDNTLNGNQFRNISTFDKCTFNVDDNYRGGLNNFITHVNLFGVSGLYFTACTFLNEQTYKNFDSENNVAIKSFDAGFTVRSSCSNILQYGQTCPDQYLTKSNFNGFKYAIHSLGSSSSNVVKVDEANFQDNIIGVYYEGLANPWITRSKFSLGNIDYPYQDGIHCNWSTGFRIEENELNSIPHSNLDIIGIRITNSGAVNNQVYKNIFHGLTTAELAEAGNRHPTENYKGLQFLCNQNSGNSFIDIRVLPTTYNSNNINNDGIRRFQGNPTIPISAGNTFSQSGNIAESDILNNTSSPIIYYYTDGQTEPIYYSNTVIPSHLYTINANTCPSNGYFSIIPSSQITSLSNEYTQKENAYLNILYNYNNLIDGGNKNLLLNKIEMSWPQDAWQLRDELMSKSPYLSEDVLRKAALKGILPQAMLLEICLANPDGTRNKNFIKFLGEEIPITLPQYMLDLIIANWDAKTARTLLEGSLADFNSGMSVIADILISNSMLDSIPNKNEARSWLLRRGNLSDYYSVAGSYIESNNFTLVNFYLNQIPNIFNLNGIQQEEHQNFINYTELRSNISLDGRNILQLDTLEIETLQQIANNKIGIASTYAQNILCYAYHQCIDNIQIDENQDKMKSTNFTNKSNKVNQKEYNQVTATPNPASIFVKFDWNLPLLKGNALLKISDLNGKILDQKIITTPKGQWIFDTRYIKNGIYLYEIKSENQGIIFNSKLIINN